MTTFDDVVNEVLLTLHGYGLAQPRASFLTAGIDDTTTTVAVTDASDFSQGIAEIGDETVFVESVDHDTNTLTLSPDGRGYYGSTATSHSANARIEVGSVWPRRRVKQAINDAIVNTFPTLFGVGVETFTFNPAVTTYDLPDGVESILSVTTDTFGLTNEKLYLNRYSFNSMADSSGANTITLLEPAFPGRTVTVTYTKAPTALDAGSDLFTDSGLRLSAKTAVVLGACSQLLTYMDAARLPVDTARADEYDSRNAIGTASRVSIQLLQRYEIELERERRRLRTTTPVPVRWRRR